jgi:hypothetical protein
MHMPNSRIAEMPTPSPILAPVERLLSAAGEAEIDGAATLVLEGVDGCEDGEMLVVAVSRIDRSELCHKIGIPSPRITWPVERVVITTLNSILVYGTT